MIVVIKGIVYLRRDSTYGTAGVIWKFGLDWFGFMVFNAIFIDISVISWRSVLLVEETDRSTRRKPPTCRKSLTNVIT